MDNYFGSPSIIRPPLDQRRTIQPDIIHMINRFGHTISRNCIWDR
ncbi:DEHA2D00220p [Debaryomyces hansenii CBS767]|uniref:DEHA2D00220p n=1 Tax=Debaryomyces hansenii (strain ATCC 36239 / CBS 767 / BCRC 21394 / JCM 1990 / NBRC 0083 / IGC 2968) TaxID=284592 RepID=B5RTP7_DEBHA|nr:DEHA2D00220p [Debaryomyces hansenii CBS767]CAR65603.1 DEHA2D00220p [Debaryomyces hansenii CBS767]|eukprot:XP_002770241.1 DEHA2D00220p [Debaryomyces hansenii CBS767]